MIFGKMFIKAVGTSKPDKRQNSLFALRKDPKAYLTLRHNKNGELGENTVEVLAHLSNGTVYHVGNLPSNVAFWVSRALDEGRIIRCSPRKSSVNGTNLNYVTGGGAVKMGVAFQMNFQLRQNEVEVETEAE